MNDYVQISEISPVDRVAPRPILPVAPVRSTVDAGQRADAASVPADELTEGADIATGTEDQLASAAETARTQAQVADILASIRAAGNSAQAAESANAALQALVPTPIVIVPLPASKDMLEQAARIAQSLVANAALAHASQAHVQPGTVDQILSQVA
ncbi:hypothetical protein C1T17_07535 [Sphingobium sp. SCG-1]|uniref:hypothetical protein n=1 Tax=Sphingobium sp. SCG-1 TaxID=2072936 RepID=UPI000CD68C93|nr:hypothetical protein [Sphingobium sp. SCG-1]AUW57979.1 hypothetical protein C1T17_07535 [Sphingobium sp. SCG-1]